MKVRLKIKYKKLKTQTRKCKNWVLNLALNSVQGLRHLRFLICVFNIWFFIFHFSGYRYNEPPTPIKSGISVNRGTDEFGYGASVNYSPLDNLNFEANYNSIKTHDKTQAVLEQIFKAKHNPNQNLEITAMLERTVKEQIEPPILKKTELKPSVEATYNFGEFFIDAGYEHNFITTDTSKYYDHALAVSVGKPELFQFTLRYERRNHIPVWLIQKLGTEKSWPMAELSLDLTSKHNLRVRVGGEKGGLVCSGGVCRFEEPFKGVKVVLTSIF